MSEYQLKAKDCKCCGKHVPLPTVLKDYHGIVVCPTTYENILEYKKIWDKAGKRPTGNIRKHFSDYIQQIVENTIDKTQQ